jgi:hypothetical protein
MAICPDNTLPASAPSQDRGVTKAESLADHIARSSPTERIEAARTVGVDVIWDSMIAPVIATDRAPE